ncbi:MAG: TRZ/ATZ family protein [Candidatus Omnitrophica bacterium]|nr:TRZ/ATZ family protein [Candidatus Omnitrophota bacterium]
MRKLTLPLKEIDLISLKTGELLFLSGKVYTARDMAHKRLKSAIRNGKKLPLPLKDQTIYYTGPTPAPKEKVIGSCGPTTSSRMDDFTPSLLKAGLKGMIGKGSRSKEVIAAIKRYKAVYFLALAGCGALLSKYIKKARVIAYKDLGTEAIYELELKAFPVIVGIDSRGRSVYVK